MDITLSSTFFFLLLTIINFKFNAIVINESVLLVILCAFDYNYYISLDIDLTAVYDLFEIDQRKT